MENKRSLFALNSVIFKSSCRHFAETNLFVSFVTLFVFLCIFCIRPVNAVMVDRVLATVGNEIITYAEYKQFAKGLQVENPEQVDDDLLRVLIEEKIIVQEAKRKGHDASDGEVEKILEEFVARNEVSGDQLSTYLAEEGITREAYRKILRDKVLQSKLIGTDIDSKTVIVEKEVEEAYRKRREEFLDSPEKLEVMALFMKLKDDASVTEITDLKRRALKIVARLKEGESFEALVEEYSDEPLRGQEGILGNFPRGAMIPALDGVAFTLKVGEISEPVWVNEGVYIIRIAGKSDPVYKPLAEVREKIFEKLYEEKRDKLFSEWMKTLWERSSVRLHQG